MTEKLPSVAVAVLYYKDGRYTGGRKPKCFPYKGDFRRFVRFNRDIVFRDEVLVVLMGGDHLVTTLDEVLKMEWTL